MSKQPKKVDPDVRQRAIEAQEAAKRPPPAPPTPVIHSDPLTHAEDPILTLTEVGNQIGKTRQTISNWIRDGLLNAIRMPSGLFGVRKSEINKFLGGSALNTRVQ